MNFRHFFSLKPVLVVVFSVFAALFIVSCDKDDDKKETAEDPISGVYEGVMALSASGQTMPDVNATVIVSLNSDKRTYKLKWVGDPNSQEPRSLKGDLDVDVMFFTSSGFKFDLSSTKLDCMVQGVRYVGTVFGSLMGNDLQLQYDMTPGSMPFAMRTIFHGSRKAE